MSIFERIQRIAKANINWLLDKVEPPQQELESKIKELEDAIREGRECAATYGATFRNMERQRDQLQAQQGERQAQAETAIQADDEDAARAQLAEKVKLAERIGQLSPGIDQGRQTYEQLRDNLVKLNDQLKSAKMKLAELQARKRSAEAHKAFGEQLDKSTSLTGQGEAFDRLEQQVVQTEAEVEIAEEIRGDMMTDLNLEQRARDLQVEAELRQLKERMNQE